MTTRKTNGWAAWVLRGIVTVTALLFVATVLGAFTSVVRLNTHIAVEAEQEVWRSKELERIHNDLAKIHVKLDVIDQKLGE